MRPVRRSRAIILLIVLLLFSLPPLPEVVRSATADFIQFGAVESYFRPEDAAEAGITVAAVPGTAN